MLLRVKGSCVHQHHDQTTNQLQGTKAVCSQSGGVGPVLQPASRGPTTSSDALLVFGTFCYLVSFVPFVCVGLAIRCSSLCVSRPVPYVSCCQASLCLLMSLIGPGNAPAAPRPLLYFPTHFVPLVSFKRIHPHSGAGAAVC